MVIGINQYIWPCAPLLAVIIHWGYHIRDTIWGIYKCVVCWLLQWHQPYKYSLCQVRLLLYHESTCNRWHRKHLWPSGNIAWQAIIKMQHTSHWRQIKCFFTGNRLQDAARDNTCALWCCIGVKCLFENDWTWTVVRISRQHFDTTCL